jgi:hypothetical protein
MSSSTSLIVAKKHGKPSPQKTPIHNRSQSIKDDFDCMLTDITIVRNDMIKEKINEVNGDNGDNDSNDSKHRVSITPAASNDIKRSSELRRIYANETSDNVHREPLLWTTSIEATFKEWQSKCLNNAGKHSAKSKLYKIVYYSLSIPTAIIPFVAAIFSDDVSSNTLVIKITLMLVGVLSAVQSIINPGAKFQSHNEYYSKYNQLAVEITKELVKPQRYRTEADVYLQKIMSEYNDLNRHAPSV